MPPLWNKKCSRHFLLQNTQWWLISLACKQSLPFTFWPRYIVYMYVCSAVYKDRLTVNHSRKFVEHQDINAQRQAHIHAMQCQMAADKCWLQCMDYNCCGSHSTGMFIFTINYFLQRLKISTRGLSFFWQNQLRSFFLLLCNTKLIPWALL